MENAACSWSLNKKKYMHIILPIAIGSIIAFIDRVNIAYAALTMNQDMGFSAQVFGMGAGIFFLGYVLFEVPGSLIANRWSARLWLARIMVVPLAFSSRMIPMNSWESLVSRWAVGSSAMMMVGLLIKARAMATR